MAQSDFIVKNGLLVLNGQEATSTSTISGAVVVDGGIGLSENLNVGGNVAITGTSVLYGPLFARSTQENLGTLRIRNTTTTAGTDTGALVVDGGVGVNGDVYVGGNIHAVGNITADGNITLGNQTSTDTLFIGAEITSDLLPKTAGKFNVGDPTKFWDNLWANSGHILATTASTSTTTGALTVAGGLGVRGNTNIGGALTVAGGITIGGIDYANYDDSIWYVSDGAGNDNTTFTYNKAKCQRDTEIILNDICMDLLFSTSSQTTFAGVQYWNHGSYVGTLASELTTTTNAINYIKNLSQRVIVNNVSGTRYQSTVTQVISGTPATSSEQDTLADNFSTILSILNVGVTGITDKITPNEVTSSTNANVWNAYLNLQANRSYLQAEAVAYVEATRSPGFTYNQTTCLRDIGYIIDSVSIDLLYGGNRQSIQSGAYYYSFNASSTALPDEQTQSVATYNLIKSMLPSIITGTLITGTYQSDVPQSVSGNYGTSAEGTIAQGLVDNITNIITNGPSVAASGKPLPLIPSSSINVARAISQIQANKDFIIAEATAFIDQTYVTVEGHGHRPESAFRTIKKALSVAKAGDTVYVLAGRYTEDFPLTIPAGVSVRGSGLREVFVQPTTATNTATAFLLNGETSLSDMSVGLFYKPGTALAFAPGMKSVKRSPYVERFTVLTTGSATSDTDPYGYDSNDAGGGGYFDGSLVDRTSIEPAILFNEVTFITPNATGVYLTNGTRCELLNGFSYFADTAIHAVAGTDGYGSAGQVRLKLANVTGTLSVGDYLYYKGSTGTVAASGQIASVVNDYVFIDGYSPGFEEASNRSGKVVNVYGNTSIDTTIKKFGMGSGHFTTPGDLLYLVNATDFQFETGAYTKEAFVYLSTSSVDQYIFNKGTIGASTTFGLSINSSNKLTGHHGPSVFTGTNSLTTGVWYHVAISRDSANTTRIFLNGNLESYNTSTANITNGAGLTVGGVEENAALSLKGYIDEVRVSSVGRYTTSFTPPTSAFASDNSTVLLLHMDGVQGSITFADDGTGTQDLYTTTSTSTAPVIATAQQISLADYTQFGAELRCIGSAAVFGNYGVVGDGVGVDLKLIAYNMSYIGSGKDLSDDPTLAVQANEVIKLNGAKIFYQTVDQLGDFRVGDQFRINQRTGNVDFGTANFRLGPLTSLTISDGVNSSILQPTSISVGSLLFSTNRLATISGNLIIDPSGSLTTINSDLQVNGALTFTGILQDTDPTNSVSTTTGAIVVAGGIGVGGDIHVGGNVYSQQGQPLYSPKVTVAPAPPAAGTNNVGDFWIDPTIGVEYQWIKDGSNYYWIQFTGI